MSDHVRHHSIPQATRDLVSMRYRTITRAVNRGLWDSSSETLHSLYVGSYGRGTAVDTSDIDVLVEVPESYYVVPHPFSTYNPQSRLLQVVKDAILASYPRSKVKGDGQVVVVDFSDGMKFEVLPAIKRADAWGGVRYEYPDTHMGGNWLSTNPKAEQRALAEVDRSSNGLAKDTCKHIRSVRDACFSSYHLSGIVIDSFVCKVIGGWHYLSEGEAPSGGPSYEEMLLNAFSSMSAYGGYAFCLEAPGSGMAVDVSNSLECLGKVLKRMA